MLEVGRVTKAHGVRGEVVVALLTDRLERVAPGSVLFAEGRPLRITASRPHQKHHIVSFDGVESREAAEALHGVVLSAEPLEDDDELWVHDLIGSAVMNPTGDRLGVVESVQANPASDLLVLDTGALIPVVFVLSHDSGAVLVDLPEGLLDL
ncbi:MAG TPA: ribosome maturation factor RimM [Acidimicrobiales bacterium]|nr:ribosome maturation factor RimM [Acidimicrobiales bacterium]